MIIPILSTPPGVHHDILHTPTMPVTDFDDTLGELVNNLWDTMYDAHGVGLAAPQICVNRRVAVIDTVYEEGGHSRLVLVNPSILSVDGEQTMEEGCLSMPGYRWNIRRSNRVYAVYFDTLGNRQTVMAEGLLARAIQHEVDHLNGLLCDRLALSPATAPASTPASSTGL